MISFIYKSKSKYRLGGAVVAGEKFKNSLIENGISLKSFSYSIGNLNILGILKDSFFRKNTAIWNLSTYSIHKFFILIFLSSYIKKKIIIRFFGSDQVIAYKNNIVIRKIFNILFLRNIYFMFETKECEFFFSNIYKKTYFFPNFIKVNKKVNFKDKTYKRKFIYVGMISSEKGVDLILEFLFRNSKFKCDFYGPIYKNYNIKNKYDLIWKKSYKGIVTNEELINIYSKYDFTILPSFKEGYPNTVLESLNQGTPLILSNINSLIEMIDKSAIFVDLNYESFEKEILNITNYQLKKMKKNIKFDLNKYNCDHVVGRFIKDML
tara:strand:- start:686 stop:1651 length:966 start_codon:yes stop_codon:yes gene_type:complete